METIKVMVNGIPGNVAALIAARVAEDERFELVPYSLTGPEIEEDQFLLGSNTIALLQPDKRDAVISQIKKESGFFISIDFTHPSAVNQNAEFYCANQLPFVMGTTGGDREKLEESVVASSIPAVIAPNMAKQIVGFQAMMAYAAETFPDLFKGYSLEIRESHQQGKADTSGTAKAMSVYFNAMGIPFNREDIVKERNPDAQMDAWGIPPDFLKGHAWHTYALDSQDGTVHFEFIHNVNGREIYVDGTLDAVLYLSGKVSEETTGKVFSMIDVLKGE